MLKFENIVCRIVFLGLFFCASLFAAPMENARGTLFILLDGMAPKSEGLFKNYCLDYERSETWGKTGVAKYFQEYVANSKANIYSRSYWNPIASPSEMVNELAKRDGAKRITNCSSYNVTYDSVKMQINYEKSDNPIITSSIIEEALEHWFKEMLIEVQLPKRNGNSIMSGAQALRFAWTIDLKPKKTIDLSTESHTNMDMRLYDWMKIFEAQNKRMPTLDELKKARPDLVPSRYIIISKGMGGMVAREYIQGENYKGDVDKVLFFDTPHEGTGFADEAILSKYPLSNFHSELGAVLAATVPIVSLGFMVVNDEIKSNLLDFTKILINEIVGIANITVHAELNDNYFNDYEADDAALWYLAQDLDKRDEKYVPTINKYSLSGLDTLIGRAQLLNSYGMITTYNNPMYRLTYSYGMPSIGNGRRLRADYLVQKKYHIDNTVLNKMIAKQAQNFYKEMLIDSLKVGELVADKISDEVYYYLSTIAEGIIPSTNFEQMWKFETGESSFILGAIDGLDSDVEVLIRENSAAWTKAAVDAGVSKAIEFVLGKYFEDFDLAKAIDALPQSIVKAISIMENLFSPILQDRVVSNFAPSFSPKYEGMDYAKDDCGIGVSVTNPFSYINITNLSGFDHARNCTAAGQNELAKGLIQYSINLFDQGTYNVPVNSSFGGAVQIFSGTDVSRRGIPLHINTPVDEEYSDYKSSLVNIGFINSNRQIVDDALKYTCMGLKHIPAYGEILEKACQVARYATNTGFMLAISVENIKLNHNHHALKSSENLSLSASTIRGNNNHTGMDSMLYESPYISLQSLVDSTSDSVRVIPLMFYKTTDDGIYASEISNYNQFKGVFIKRLGLLDTNQLKPLEIYPYEANINSYSNNELKTINDYHSLTVKTVNYEKIGETGIVRRVSRKNIPHSSGQNVSFSHQ